MIPVSEVYLDNNATTYPLPEVVDVMVRTMSDRSGNASSVHESGERARKHLRDSREHIAGLVGAKPEQVVFTSGGTEANNQVLSSLRPNSHHRLITSTIEHSSVLKKAEQLEDHGVNVVYLPVGKDGLVDLNEFRKAIESPADLVSIQWVNNETGVIQPIGEISALCRTTGIPLHVDAAQALGKIDIDFSRESMDYLTITAHKIHGPQGIGAVIARDPVLLEPLLRGGDQESSRRPGTENIPAIAGFGEAARVRTLTMQEVTEHMRSLRDRFVDLLQESLPYARVNGDEACLAPNTVNMMFQGVDGQALVARLDQVGVCCSQSSACTNRRPEPSYVLRAMGLSEEEAYSSVRFSVSALNTTEDIMWAVTHIVDLCESLRPLTARSA